MLRNVLIYSTALLWSLLAAAAGEARGDVAAPGLTSPEPAAAANPPVVERPAWMATVGGMIEIVSITHAPKDGWHDHGPARVSIGQRRHEDQLVRGHEDGLNLHRLELLLVLPQHDVPTGEIPAHSHVRQQNRRRPSSVVAV